MKSREYVPEATTHIGQKVHGPAPCYRSVATFNATLGTFRGLLSQVGSDGMSSPSMAVTTSGSGTSIVHAVRTVFFFTSPAPLLIHNDTLCPFHTIALSFQQFSNVKLISSLSRDNWWNSLAHICWTVSNTQMTPPKRKSTVSRTRPTRRTHCCSHDCYIIHTEPKVRCKFHALCRWCLDHHTQWYVPD